MFPLLPFLLSIRNFVFKVINCTTSPVWFLTRSLWLIATWTLRFIGIIVSIRNLFLDIVSVFSNRFRRRINFWSINLIFKICWIYMRIMLFWRGYRVGISFINNFCKFNRKVRKIFDDIILEFWWNGFFTRTRVTLSISIVFCSYFFETRSLKCNITLFVTLHIFS